MLTLQDLKFSGHGGQLSGLQWSNSIVPAVGDSPFSKFAQGSNADQGDSLSTRFLQKKDAF
jgi:hypothetical protein